MKTLAPLTLACLTLITSPSHAQTLPDAGQLLREQQRETIPLPPVQPLHPLTPPANSGATDTPAPAPAPAPDPGPRFLLQRIHLTGVSEAYRPALETLVASETGQETSFHALQQLASRLTTLLRNQGLLLARAWLPAQTLRNGEIEIRIEEGSLESWQAHGTPAQTATAEKLLSALNPQSALQRDELERTLLLINEQPGLAGASSGLTPGAAIGSTRLTLRFPETASDKNNRFFSDNHGGYYTGKTRLGLQSQLTPSIGTGDRLNLTLLATENNTWNGQVDWSTLLTSSGLRGGITLSSNRYELGKTYKKLQAHGQAHTLGFTLSHPLLRRLSHSIDLGSQIEHRWLKDRMDAHDTQSDKAIDALVLNAAGRHRDTTGTNTWSLSLTTGQLDIGTRASRSIDRQSAKAAGDYTKGSLFLQREQSLSARQSLRGWVKTQWASKNLDSSEKFGLGGIYGIRAYPQGELWGDEGRLARIDWRFLMSEQCAIGLGYDAGRVRLNKHRYLPGSNSETRKGWALFADGRRGDFDLSATLAWRDGEEAVSSPDKRPRVWVQGGMRF